MAYAKLFSSITESSLWCEPKEVRLLFVSMLAKADSEGFVEAALPGLARLANLTVREVEEAIQVLEGPDVHSKNPEHDGRRIAKVPGGWMILNYQDYRNRRSDEDRRTYMREYMREYRSKHGVNIVSRSKPPLAQGEGEGEAETEESFRSEPIGPIGASPRSKKEFSGRGEGEALDLSSVDWSAVQGMAEAVAVRVPPLSTEDRRAWLRYAVMAVVEFSEGWLMNAAESARATRQQNITKRSKQAHFVAILKAEAAKQGCDGETFNGIARRIEIPDVVWKSGILPLTGRRGK